MENAFKICSETLGIKEAVEWSGGFTFSTEVKSRDTIALTSAGGSIKTLAKRTHDEHRPNRLNVDRVRRCLGSNGEWLTDPNDYRRAMGLCVGMRIITHPQWRPQVTPTKKRGKYLSVAPAVNRLLNDQRAEGTILIIQTSALLALPPGSVHFGPQHWATKAGKACGRAITDASHLDTNSTGHPVNGSCKEHTDWVRNEIARTYGEIIMPTLDDLMHMIMRAADIYGWDDLVLFKVDLHGAFNLINIHPDDVWKMVYELTEGVCAVHITGSFGYTGTPAAFAVISRILNDLTNRITGGFTAWYVDDGMGVGPKQMVDDWLKAITKTIEDLLGPTSVEYRKVEKGRKLDWIGWEVDLDAMSVSLSKKNMDKTIYAFFSTSFGKSVSLRDIQALHSRAIRTATLCDHLKLFTVGIAKNMSGKMTNSNSMRSLSEEAKTDILMWRAFLCLLAFMEEPYRRTIRSFALEVSTVLIEGDASLGGIGVGVNTWCFDTGQWELIGYTAINPLPFTSTTDSSFQNCFEFLVIVIGLAMAGDLGLRHFTYATIGDNTTALSWVKHDRADSSLARRSAFVYHHIRGCLNARPGYQQHIAGVDNEFYDALSREGHHPREAFCGHLRRWYPGDSPMMQLVKLCNPNDPIKSHDDYTLLLRRSVEVGSLFLV